MQGIGILTLQSIFHAMMLPWRWSMRSVLQSLHRCHHNQALECSGQTFTSASHRVTDVRTVRIYGSSGLPRSARLINLETCAECRESHASLELRHGLFSRTIHDIIAQESRYVMRNLSAGKIDRLRDPRAVYKMSALRYEPRLGATAIPGQQEFHPRRLPSQSAVVRQGRRWLSKRRRSSGEGPSS